MTTISLPVYRRDGSNKIEVGKLNHVSPRNLHGTIISVSLSGGPPIVRKGYFDLPVKQMNFCLELRSFAVDEIKIRRPHIDAIKAELRIPPHAQMESSASGMMWIFRWKTIVVTPDEHELLFDHPDFEPI